MQKITREKKKIWFKWIRENLRRNKNEGKRSGTMTRIEKVTSSLEKNNLLRCNKFIANFHFKLCTHFKQTHLENENKKLKFALNVKNSFHGTKRDS